MTTEELIEHWQEFNDCSNFKEIEGVGLCGVQRFAFTYGLVKGYNKDWFDGRWCFSTKQEAEIALKYWDGKGDPPGMWIKYKGEIEYGNIFHPNFNHKFDTPSPHLKQK